MTCITCQPTADSRQDEVFPSTWHTIVGYCIMARMFPCPNDLPYILSWFQASCNPGGDFVIRNGVTFLR